MSARTGVLFLALLSLAGAPAALAQERAADSARGRAPEPEITEEGEFYTVVSGDTLSEIAERFGVSVEDLVGWNDGLEPDRLAVGQRLRLSSSLRRVEHLVLRGETLSRIAARYEVRVGELLRWNRRLRPDHLRAGRRLVVFTSVPSSRSRSIGFAYRGRLVDPARMPLHHPGLHVRAPSRAYGTDETVRLIVEAYDELRRADPDAPEIEVHDLSDRDGGPLMGHHSHRSGRDADLAYFQRRCSGRCGFRHLRPEDLDAERQWRIFRYWLSRGVVDAIFVDHSLQRALYEQARREGVDRRTLARWFQYPRPPEDRQGIIRHYPRHADHFHVRFRCHESDPECR